MMEYKVTEQYRIVEYYITYLQNTICDALSEIDGGAFSDDKWKREDGRGGITRVIKNGRVFEKGTVNISSVY